MKKIYQHFLLLITTLLSSCDMPTIIKTNYDLNKYEEYVNKCVNPIKSFMPSLDSLTDYNKILVSLTFSYCEARYYGYMDNEPYGLILFVLYSEQIFKNKKDEINQTYSFVESSIIDKGKDNIIPPIDMVYCDYRIRMVYDGDFDYPKYFGMIGINENKNTIAYLAYQNQKMNDVEFENDSIETQTNWFIDSILSQMFVFL